MKGKEEVEKAIGKGEHESDIVGFTPRTKRIFELSLLQARNLGHNYVGTEHILLGLLSEGEGVAVLILQNLGVDIQKLANRVVAMTTESVNKPGPSKQGAAGEETPNLEKYSVDLNKLAEEGGIDPVIGRNDEIQRLSRS